MKALSNYDYTECPSLNYPVPTSEHNIFPKVENEGITMSSSLKNNSFFQLHVFLKAMLEIFFLKCFTGGTYQEKLTLSV